MKRLFIFLICIMFICISKAEINTSILGLNLGTSSKQNVETMYKQKGLRYEYMNPQTIFGFGKIYFAGLEFNAIVCTFYDNRLTSLTLCGEKENQFENLYYSLANKYKELTPKFDEEFGYIIWGDDYNEIIIHLDKDSPEKLFYLTYTNLELTAKALEQNASEL